MTKQRSLVVPGLVLALVLAVAGCGGQPFPEAGSPSTRGGTPATAQARLLAAVKRTDAARTARFSVDMSISGLGRASGNPAGTMTVKGSGAMDLAHRRFEMKVTSTDPSRISVEIRVVGNTMYFNAGSGWKSQAVATANALTPVPTNYLDYLKGLGGTVRVEGRETLRGERTTRYGASIDFSRVAARAGDAAQRALVKQLLAGFGLTKIPVTVWLDDLGRMRKMTMTLDLGSLGEGMNAPAGFAPKMEITLEMYDFGSAVAVAVPSGAVKSATTFCLTGSCDSSGTADAANVAHAIQSDLRNALTAEKVFYIDNEVYTADAASLKEIEPSLDWGGRLKVAVGDSSAAASGLVCMSETMDGMTYSIADVASGASAGTYYGAKACPAQVTEAKIASTSASW